MVAGAVACCSEGAGALRRGCCGAGDCFGAGAGACCAICGAGGAGVTCSPCGTLFTSGLCRDDSAGGASAPRGGARRGAFCAVCAGAAGAGAGSGLGVAAGAGGAWTCAGAGCVCGAGAAGGGVAATDGAGGGGVGADEAEGAAGVGVGCGGDGGGGGGAVTAVRPGRRSSLLYFALLRSATRLLTSFSRSMLLSAVSGSGGTLPRLGKGSLLPSCKFC